MTTTYGYDVFGATRSQSGTPDTVFRFTGEQRDVESGLYYLRARYYDPDIGRFLTRDALAGTSVSPKSLHRYVYAENNPTNLVDPLGLCGWRDPWDCPVDAADQIRDGTLRAADWTRDRAVEAARYTGDRVHAADVWLAENAAGQFMARLSFGDVRASNPKEGGFVIVENCGGLCALLLKAAGDPTGITVGRYVFSRATIPHIVEQHERVHVEQYRRYGLIGFLFRYFVVEPAKDLPDCGLNSGCYYDKNGLEEEASRRALQGR